MANKNNLTPVEEKYAKYFADPNVLEVLEDNNGKVFGIKMKDGRTLAPKKYSQEQSFVNSPSKKEDKKVSKPAETSDKVEQVSIEDLSNTPIDFSITPEKNAQKEEKKKQKDIKEKIKNVNRQGKSDIKKEKQATKKAEEAKKANDARQKTQMMLFELAKKQAELSNNQEIHKQNAIAREQAAAVQDFYNKQVLAEQQTELDSKIDKLADLRLETKKQEINLNKINQKVSVAYEKNIVERRQASVEKEIARLEKRKVLSEEEQKYLKDVQKEQKNLSLLKEKLAVSELDLDLKKEVLNSQIKAIDNEQTAANLKIAKLLPEGNVLNASQLTIKGFEDMAKTLGLSEEQQKKYSNLISEWKNLQLEKDGLKKQRNLLNKENRENLKKENTNSDIVETAPTAEPIIETTVEPIAYSNLGDNFVNADTQGEIQNINSAEGDSFEYDPNQNLEHFALYNQEDSDNDAQNANSLPQEPVVEPIAPPVAPTVAPPTNETQSQPTAPKKENNPKEKKEDKKDMKTVPDKQPKPKLIDPSPLTVDQHVTFAMMLMFATALSIIFGMPIFMYVGFGVYAVAALSASRPWIPTLKQWQEYKQKRFEKKAAKQLARDKKREKIVARTNERKPQINRLKKQKFGVLNEIDQQKSAIKNLKKEKAKLKKAKETSVKDMQVEAINKQLNIEKNKLESLKTQAKSLENQSHLLYTEEKSDKKIKKTVKKETKKLNALDKNTLENYSLEHEAIVSIEKTKLTELKNKNEQLKKQEGAELASLISKEEMLKAEKEKIVAKKKDIRNQIASIAKDSGITLQKTEDGSFVPVSTNKEFEEKTAALNEEIKGLDSRYEKASQEEIEARKDWSEKRDRFIAEQNVREDKIKLQEEHLKSVKKDSKARLESETQQLQGQIQDRKENLKTLKKGKTAKIETPAANQAIEMPRTKLDDTTLVDSEALEVSAMPGFENFTLSDEEPISRTNLFEPVDPKAEPKDKKKKNAKDKTINQ